MTSQGTVRVRAPRRFLSERRKSPTSENKIELHDVRIEAINLHYRVRDDKECIQ